MPMSAISRQQLSALVEKIESLPPERLAEVEDFVDFLQTRESDQALVKAAAAMSAPAFAEVWDNPEDAAYDAL